MTPGEAAIITQRLDSIAEDVKEIRAQTTRTNGRVSAIELSRAREAGELAARVLADANSHRRTAEYIGWGIAVAAILGGAYT